MNSLVKRKTYQPEKVESITEPTQGFAQIDFADIDTVIEKKLTAAELRLWLYLMKLDRFGDRWIDLPKPSKLAVRLGMSCRTVEKAMFKLDELNLYTIRVKEWEGANSSAAKARQTAQDLKVKKEEKLAEKPLEPAQGKSGYLAENPVNLPDSEKLAENPVNLPKVHIYSSRAGSDLTDSLTDSEQTATEQAAATKQSFDEKVPESEEENRTVIHPSKLQIENSATEAMVIHQGTSSAAPDPQILKEIQRAAFNWRLRPWMESATEFKAEMKQAVWESNPDYYSHRGKQTPNHPHIFKALRRLDNKLRGLDVAAIDAWHELIRYWQTAQVITNPQIENAFVAAAAETKKQTEEMKKQQRIKETIENLKEFAQ